MSFSRMIKLANKIEKKYLISFATYDANNEIYSASITCEPDYETEYFIYLTVEGVVKGKSFNIEGLETYIAGAEVFDNYLDLADKLNDSLANHLVVKNMISREEANSLTLMYDYLNNLSFDEQDSWLNEVNTVAKSINNAWNQELQDLEY